MRVNCFLLLVSTFYTSKGIEYVNAIGHENITLWPNYDEALQKVTEGRTSLEDTGYKLSCSDTGGEDSPLLYQCRYEHPDGRAVAFAIIRKTIEGDLFIW